MKKTLLFSYLLALFLISCHKQDIKSADEKTLRPPSGFSWEMSSNIAINIGINDNRFGDALHSISIYDAPPESGGRLITTGSATNNLPFITTIYLADALQTLFVTKTAPDSSIIGENLTINAKKIKATLGAVPVPTGKPLDGPDCAIGCTRTITSSNTNINVNTGETVCITGDNIIVGFTATNNGTVRICGSNVTVQNSNLNNNSKLIIASSGSANFQSLIINKGINFANYGTCTITDAFSINGPVINAGKLMIDNNFTVNNGATISNTGSLDVNGTININSSSNTNKGTIITKDLAVNGQGSFTNFCSLEIANSYINNGLTANYQLITVGGNTSINGGSSINLYNSAMITTNNIIVNGKINGYGTTSIVKVANSTTLNGGAGITGSTQFCDLNGIEVNNGGNFVFNNGAVQSCNVYIPVNGCNKIGNGTQIALDADSDGAPDAIDEYPNDPSKAFNNYYPAAGNKATFAFEDLWPSKGDYDFNDLVMDYQYNIITNAANKVATVIANFNLLASGGIINNGFGVEFPILRSSVGNVSGSGLLEPNQMNAVIVLFTDMRKEMQWGNSVESQPQTPAVPYTISFDVKNGPLLSSFVLGSYNPFIWNSAVSNTGGRNEIHLPGHTATTLGSTNLFGTNDDNTNIAGNRFYLSKDGMPWALNIPATFKHPIEAANINSAYTKFTGWANSGGLAFTNWYVNLSGNTVNSFIYKP